MINHPDAVRIHDNSTMECKICWAIYNPSEGDEIRQIPPGTPFLQLPADWCCPQCGSPAELFIIVN